jgi:hypothetical protein
MNYKLFFFLSFFIFSFSKDVPKNTNLANINVLKAYSQNILGKNVGYYVEFKNNASNEVDALKWKALFYDNFNDLKGQADGNWSSGNFISSIKKGETCKDLETAWVKDATKVFIKITRVHFTNGKTFGK